MATGAAYNRKHPRAIGIDLGTTFSCVAVYRKGPTKEHPFVTDVLPDEYGHRTIPSWVSFNENKKLVGHPAKSQVAENPTNTVYDAKRLIGRRFDDVTVQEDAKLWPFTVVELNNKVVIQVTNEDGSKTTFHPEQISAFVLEKILTISRQFLGFQITDAVITVPAYFNDSQRQATKDAGVIAGLNVLRIINEPTAAAIAYGLNKDEVVDAQTEDEINVLVFDLGGGTFDVSILGIECGVFEVKATSGDTHLGGQDFTNQLVNHFADQYHSKFGVDVFEHKNLLSQLREACENVKHQLSASMEANLFLVDIIGTGDFQSKISRARFDMLNEELFLRVLEPVKQALADAGLKKSDIHEILMVGGSTRIPKIKSLLREFFDGKELRDDVNPDEVVACGAAIHAAILSGDSNDEEESKLHDTVLLDISPLSLGIETYGGQMNNIIERNTKLPVSKTKMFTTYEDFQRIVLVQVFEGERPLTKDNNSLGDFKFTNIPPALRGVPKIEVEFKINTDGILTVSAKDVNTGVEQNVRIENAKGRLSQDEIKEMIDAANRYKEEDEKEMLIVKAKLQLSSAALRMLSLTKNSQLTKGNIDQDDVATIKRTCHAALEWMEMNPDEAREEYENKFKEITTICDPISAKALFIRQKQCSSDDID